MSGRQRRIVCTLGCLSLALCPIANGLQADSPRRPTAPIASSQSLDVGQATLQIDFAEGPLDLPKSQIVHRIQLAANAVMAYYGQFPIPRARVLVIPVAGKHGVLQGTTWGNRDGFPAFLRLRIGQSTTASELSADWIITHELVHTALPSLRDDQHWLEEGLASYVEPVARVQAGELTSQVIWGDMMHGMPNGEPGLDDHGLNNTHTWGRTYWGGALFCMMADIQIRKQTGNRLGLQDSLRAIVAAGGTIDKDWPLARILSIGDQATGTHVLEEMYPRWSETPVPVNLAEIWSQLGVQKDQTTIVFDSKALLAPIRLAITDLPKSNAIK
jgi:hypothetical protein